MAILSERLTQLREEKGWSKTLVASKLNFKNMATYANYEYGTREPDTDTLKLLASLYDVSIDYLVGATDKRHYYDLTEKDEKDVQETLKNMVGGLTNKESLSYLKNDGEEISDEDAKLLAASLENVIRQSKIIAKRKFTPKKYRD